LTPAPQIFRVCRGGGTLHVSSKHYMGPTPFYGDRVEKNPQKADFATKQTNICRLSGDIIKHASASLAPPPHPYPTPMRCGNNDGQRLVVVVVPRGVTEYQTLVRSPDNSPCSLVSGVVWRRSHPLNPASPTQNPIDRQRLITGAGRPRA